MAWLKNQVNCSQIPIGIFDCALTVFHMFLVEVFVVRLGVPMLLHMFAKHKRIHLDSPGLRALPTHWHIHLRAHDVAISAGGHFVSRNLLF